MNDRNKLRLFLILFVMCLVNVVFSHNAWCSEIEFKNICDGGNFDQLNNLSVDDAVDVLIGKIDGFLEARKNLDFKAFCGSCNDFLNNELFKGQFLDRSEFNQRFLVDRKKGQLHLFMRLKNADFIKKFDNVNEVFKQKPYAFENWRQAVFGLCANDEEIQGCVAEMMVDEAKVVDADFLNEVLGVLKLKCFKRYGERSLNFCKVRRLLQNYEVVARLLGFDVVKTKVNDDLPNYKYLIVNFRAVLAICTDLSRFNFQFK